MEVTNSMNVFYIKGKSNSGKTGSIKHAMKMLLERKDSSVLYVFRIPRDKKSLIKRINDSIRDGLNSDTNIGLVVIQIKDKTIGITTYGDSLKEIRTNLSRAIEVTQGKLDVFVCARHDNNDIEMELNEFVSRVGSIVVNEPIPSKRIEGNAADYNKANHKKGTKLCRCIVGVLGLD